MLPATDAIKVGMGGNSPLKRMLDHPSHYQPQLADVIRRERPNTMIETGVESGYSTEHFVTAMDAAGKGHLYSCDPSPTGFYQAHPIVHPRFTFIQARSQDCLPALVERIGPVDLFLHDSDHSFECMTWELEWAWKNVRSGGIIASDDVGWGVQTVNGMIDHKAWERFCQRHGVAHLRTKIDNAEFFKKP